MNEKNQYKRWLWWLPTILMMIIIFMFSAKPADISDGTSSPIAEAIVNIFETLFGEISLTKRSNVVEMMNFIVRKAAHITEYMILAICVSLPLWINQIQEKKRFFCAGILSVIYAGTDEYHQTFVEGRSGSIKDVGIDSIGIMIGCFLFILFVRSYKKRKQAQD